MNFFGIKNRIVILINYFIIYLHHKKYILYIYIVNLLNTLYIVFSVYLYSYV